MTKPNKALATPAQPMDYELVGLRIEKIINSPAARKLGLAELM